MHSDPISKYLRYIPTPGAAHPPANKLTESNAYVSMLFYHTQTLRQMVWPRDDWRMAVKDLGIVLIERKEVHLDITDLLIYSVVPLILT